MISQTLSSDGGSHGKRESEEMRTFVLRLYSASWSKILQSTVRGGWIGSDGNRLRLRTSRLCGLIDLLPPGGLGISLQTKGSRFQKQIPPPFDLARLSHYLQLSLTIFRSVTVRCPCSESFFFIPLSFAASLASSFMLCMVELETAPVAVTV